MPNTKKHRMAGRNINMQISPHPEKQRVRKFANFKHGKFIDPEEEDNVHEHEHDHEHDAAGHNGRANGNANAKSESQGNDNRDGNAEGTKVSDAPTASA